MSDYHEFIRSKSQISGMSGFEPIWMPDCLFPFQRYMTEWAIRKGRAALFEDCGLGKTLQQLVWAQNVVEQTNRPVMLATPIAVGAQTASEAERFGIKARRTRNGVFDGEACVWVTNYEQLGKYDPMQFIGKAAKEEAGTLQFDDDDDPVDAEIASMGVED